MSIVLKKLKSFNKEINKLMLIFCDKYRDIFTKKNLIKYDEMVDLDYAIIKIFKEFVCLLDDTEFDINGPFLNSKHKKIYENLLNAKKPDLELVIQNKTVDGLYYSYLLCQMYILLPFIIYQYIYNNSNINKITNPNIKIKKEYKLYSTKFAFFMYNNPLVFKRWDETENLVNGIPFDEDERIELLNNSLIDTHSLFRNLFLNYFLISEWFPNSTKKFTFMNSLTNWKTILIFGLITIVLIVGIALIITFSITGNKNN